MKQFHRHFFSTFFLPLALSAAVLAPPVARAEDAPEREQRTHGFTYKGQVSERFELFAIRHEYEYRTRIGETTCTRWDTERNYECEWKRDARGDLRYECEWVEHQIPVKYPCIGEIREIIKDTPVPVRKQVEVTFATPQPLAQDVELQIKIRMDEQGQLIWSVEQSGGERAVIMAEGLQSQSETLNTRFTLTPFRLPDAKQIFRSARLEGKELVVELGTLERSEEYQLRIHVGVTSGQGALIEKSLNEALGGQSLPARLRLDLAPLGFNPSRTAVVGIDLSLRRQIPKGALNAEELRQHNYVQRVF